MYLSRLGSKKRTGRFFFDIRPVKAQIRDGKVGRAELESTSGREVKVGASGCLHKEAESVQQYLRNRAVSSSAPLLSIRRGFLEAT